MVTKGLAGDSISRLHRSLRWCQGVRIDGAGAPVGERIFNLVQVEDLAKLGVQLVAAGQARGVMSGLQAKSSNNLLQQDLWIETGRDLGADAVIVGHLFRFRERIGTQYSAEVPASVAFDIHLISVRDGRLLWDGNFDETQQSLFEDLYQLGTFLQRGGRWITAQELAVSGLESIFATFPASAKGLQNQ